MDNDFVEHIPEEPIMAAAYLINLKRTEPTETITVSVYSCEDLRQIAKHLLVYCDSNEEL